MQRLIDEPKGKKSYTANQPVLLQVFWECPSLAAANRLLDALSQCAKATQRDTPCVPTYFFRISHNDKDLYGATPKLVKEHKQLMSLIKKLDVGISKNAVHAETKRNELDVAYLDLDPSSELPSSLQEKPVAVECTELYLDERAFMEHVGSRDYLKAYGLVMSPALMSAPATTLRFGTPCESLIEKILDPVLKAQDLSVPTGFSVWNKPATSNAGVLVSMDVGVTVAPTLSLQSCAWSLFFQHPRRQDVSRVMVLFAGIPDLASIQQLASLKPVRGEAHVKGDEASISQVTNILKEGGLEHVSVNVTRGVGYILHDLASELQFE